MLRHPLFLTYGLAIVSLAGLAEYQGWSVSNNREVRNVPKSIRDNPGAYRSIYTGYPRYTGGK